MNDSVAGIMTFEQRHLRDWYYRNAVTAFREYLKKNVGAKGFRVYADTLLAACEKDPEKCAEFIEQSGDRLRYMNFHTDRKGKLIGFDVVWDTDKEWKERNKMHESENGGSR